MQESFLKYLIFVIVFCGIGFFILQKNLNYNQLAKEEKKLVQKIYNVEEQRRYKLYYLEKQRKDNLYQAKSSRIMVLNVNEKS